MSDTADAKPTQPVEEDWTTFSDGELMARLLRRGVEPVMAKGWVRDREHEAIIEEINEVLTVPFLDDEGKPIRFETPIDRRARR